MNGFAAIIFLEPLLFVKGILYREDRNILFISFLRLPIFPPEFRKSLAMYSYFFLLPLLELPKSFWISFSMRLMLFVPGTPPPVSFIAFDLDLIAANNSSANSELPFVLILFTSLSILFIFKLLFSGFTLILFMYA